MEPSIEPLRDTWSWHPDLSSWGISIPCDFKDWFAPEINAWCGTSLSKTLEVFSNLIRIRRTTIVPIYSSNTQPIEIEWHLGESYSNYVEVVLKAIQEYSAPIYRITADIDLFVYVRTELSVDKPIRVWVSLSHNELTIWAPDNGEAGLYLTIGYTLFGPGNKEYGPITGPYPEEEFEEPLDNNELQLLNQPLLEKALKRWEEYFGSITEVDGIPGIYKYGFLVEPY